ncbi:MAG TPA: MFS transporter [Candidatus Sulfotelmatobacter sp.]|nr:MFS transporter [Candidatus Sulfotelmatobacter sp.]
MNTPASREEGGLRPVDPSQPRSAHEPHPAMNRVLFLIGLSVLINYIDRSNLSIAAPLLQDELHISGKQLGTLLSAFFWTYALLQIPAGWLVDHFDVKWVFAVGFFVWSAATGITGVLHGFVALLAIRIVLGVGESVAFPAYGKILGTHFQESRRGFANSVVITGLALGPAIGMLVGGTVVGRFGWRPFFLVLGLVGLLWLVPWWMWMPRQQVNPAREPDGRTGVLAILRQLSAWGTCLCQFSFNYASYFLVTWLPYYLTRERHLSMNRMARVGGFVYLLFAISSTVLGKLSDRWIASGGSPTRVRKTLAAGGSAGMGIFLAASAIAPHAVFIWTLALVGVFMGMSACNIWAMTQTLAGPRMVGRWTGVQNFVGNFAGAVAPTLAGFLLDRTGHFYWAFFITAVVVWIGALSWIFIVGPIEEVVWKKDAPRPRAISAPSAP